MIWIRVCHVIMAVLLYNTGVGAEKDSDETKPFSLSEPTSHIGCCDASAGVAVSSNLFLMANDEDNLLRVYRRDRSGPPVQAFQAGPFLRVDPKKPESDIEGAARVGDRIYWITSHGRNRSGEARESRHRFFATIFRVNDKGVVELKVVGVPYTRLLSDLIKDARLAKFNLLHASTLAPKEEGGLNIEGMCGTANGEMLIGFRNPIPDKQALIVPLKNPSELVEGKPAKFGDPILLDLEDRGVRDMTRVGERILIIGGPSDGKGNFHLYEWDGRAPVPHKIPATHFRGINPEALVIYPDAPPNEFQILSDDGTRKVAGLDCKLVPDSSRRAFRSFWAHLD
ncbi:MAG TPA: DUF3616 domain-containing protein [Candidatus Limnocylindria bacterium]|nr:DUF3616 domain-containing protein [Candidatus Limnocylindria bacterium]